jgi:hypothetical protein
MNHYISFGMVLVLAAGAVAQLPNPALTQIYPSGAQRGSELEVTIAGRDLDEARQLVFTHSGIQGVPKRISPNEFETDVPSPNQFVVRVGLNVPPGLYEGRVVGKFGLSTPRAFIVQSEPLMLDPGNNHALETAQPLPLDTAVYGRADQNAVDYYRVELRKGQTVSILCQCAEIDSRMEPLIEVSDAAGKFLVASRSTRIPRLHFSAPEDGSYIVTVNDHVYAGGDEFAYRLSVSSAPYIEFVLPPVGTPGRVHDFVLYGTNLPESTDSEFDLDGIKLKQKKVRIFIPPAGELDAWGPAPSFVCGQRALGFSLSDHAAFNTVPIGIAENPIVVEQEPNDRQHPQRVSLPLDYAGNLFPERDEDWVRFSAKQGEIIQIDVFGHRQGIDMDPALFAWQVMKDPDGAEKLNNLDTVDDRRFDRKRLQRAVPRAFDYSDKDPSLRVTIPQDGDYCISLRDAYGANRSDPRAVYRISIGKPRPSFQLIAWTQRFRTENDAPRVEAAAPVVRRGGSVSIPVDVIRAGGFAGDVAISADNLPAGVSCSAVTAGPGQSEAVLIITAASDAPFAYGIIRIVGTADLEGRPVSQEASYGVLLSESPDVRNEPVRGRTTRNMTLTVIAEDAPAVVRIEGGAVFETSRGGTLKIPISYTRKGNVKADLKLQPVGLPDEIKASELVLKPDASEGVLELTLNNANIPLGTYSFCLVGQTAIDHQRNPDDVARAEQAQKSFEAVVAEIAESEKDATAKLEAAKKELEQCLQRSKQAAESHGQVEAAMSQAQEQLAAAKANLSAVKSVPDAAAVPAAESRLKEADEQTAQISKSLAEAARNVATSNEAVSVSQMAVSQAEELVKQITEKKGRAEQHRKALEERVNQAKKRNEAKNITNWLASTPATLRVAKMPVKTMLPSELMVKRSNDGPIELELAVKTERLFGFGDPIELRAEPPPNSPGLEPVSATVAKDQSDSVLRLVIKPEAKPGRYSYRLTTKLRFGDVDLEDSIPISIQVSE